jgi:pSer/pThr/pTyr-binding forkhead associated (FHA) protein
MHAQLIPFDGTAAIEIVKDLTLVGRQEECDLRLSHKSISKFHCVIVKTDGLLFLRDLGSTNGTRVNGERVRRAALLPNDLLAIAGHKFRVSLGPDKAIEARTDRTQPLEPKEIAQLLRQADARDPLPDLGQSSAPSVQPNPLPDRYPESEAEPR